jgi:hypothetical protein
MDKAMPAFLHSSWGRTIFALAAATVAFALAAAGFFSVAIRQASARFPLCGPASFDASNTWCRAATGDLAIAAGAATVAIALGLLTLWTVRRYLRQRNRQPAFAGQLA